MATDLRGAHALVTGGGSGIGLASATVLAADGAVVTLMGRTADRLEHAAETIRGSVVDAEVRTIVGDVTDEDDVRAAVEAARSPTGGLDCCVAAAGDGTLGPVIATSLDEWNRIVSVSLTGTFLTIKHAASAMATSGGGSIVAVSSVASHVTHRYMAPYCAAKAGVDMLVRTAADELGQVGVRVNAVNPGIIRTDLVAMIHPDDSTGRSYLENMPLRRFGEVDDVAPAIRFLCGPGSSFVTGATLPVDGGHSLRRGPDYHEIAVALYGAAADGVPPEPVQAPPA
ncbi:MAG: SDR family oxidoreductase [Microthrixaceae bacterium]